MAESKPTRPRVSDNTYTGVVAHHRNKWWSWIPFVGKRAPKRPNVAPTTYDRVVAHWRATTDSYWTGKPIIGVFLVVIVLVTAFLLYGLTRADNPSEGSSASIETSGTPATPVSNTATLSAGSPDMVENANKTLQSAGWKPNEFLLGDYVNPSKDRSTTGDGAFKADGARTPAEMVKYLGAGSPGAKALMACLVAGTGATQKEVLDKGNWIEVQSKVPFTYPGNTSFKGGMVVNAGTRNGEAGDIFLLFVSPSKHKAVAVRGACGNAQVFIPTPTTPTTPGTKLAAKNQKDNVGSNPKVAEWKKDEKGGGHHKVTGKGGSVADAKQAEADRKAAAEAAAAADKAAADKARNDANTNGADQPDTKQDKTKSSPPPATW